MVKDLIDKLIDGGFHTIVVTGCCHQAENSKAMFIEDPRSAAFYALGLLKTGSKRLALIVDENYVGNMYTALTECWFQRIPLLVVTYNANVNNSLEYLDRCIDYKTNVRDIDSLPNVLSCCQDKHSPTLIRVHQKDSTEEFVCLEICKKVQLSGYNGRILAYGQGLAEKPDAKPINPRHKFGTISKYIGYTVSKDALLIIPEHILGLDANILNCRYISPKVKIIVIADGHDFKIGDWARGNSIEFIEGNLNDSVPSIQELVKSELPSILYLK